MSELEQALEDYAALSGSPGARTYYDQLRGRGTPTTPHCGTSFDTICAPGSKE